ncbi:hypothetical protein BD289DRAFT_102170 [Coniella lustricola]|uniref:Uncharacterized protein n=1 Tax=Coniella lustricola TaxID=2025994 RepID=A0A2T3AGU1_9PEZI|nr:hypothetical protein BD289DRAFT_102170 [Coniella lustricola]
MNTDLLTKAPKDKTCPYCGQAFTSSSLGRHLDLYIKEKNPKAPDGIHDVDEIRKLRGTITRRHPRGSSRRNTASSATAGSQAGSKRSPMGSDGESVRSPEEGDIGAEPGQKGHQQRVLNRSTMKSSLEIRHRVQDALDTARAAELALREMISSWRAVKHQIGMGSMPFDINPLSLDFPALCLQFLDPPPTLYSSTPHTTSTSWSISPPNQQQKDSLTIHFREQFKKWKSSSIASTAVTAEDIIYRPSHGTARQEDVNCLLQRAEEAAMNLEKQVAEHLSISFQAWDTLPVQRQLELWNLEMARSIGKRQQQISALQETQYTLKQENANLKSQLDNLNRESQPKEFKIIPPMTLRVDGAMRELWAEAGASNSPETGLDTGVSHADLGTLVSGAIERWKSVVVASRTSSGMNLQRDFDHVSAPIKTPTSGTYPMTPDISRSTQQRKRSQYINS